MPDRSTEHFDPFITAGRGRSYKGTIPLSQLARLRDFLIDDKGGAQYELLFAREDKVYAVIGQVTAEMVLVCQACLDKMNLSVTVEVQLGIVSSLDEVARLSDRYEPLLVVDRKITLTEIVEEELLLAIPIIPRHQQCRIANEVDQGPVQKKENPFSILAELKLVGDQSNGSSKI